MKWRQKANLKSLIRTVTNKKASVGERIQFMNPSTLAPIPLRIRVGFARTNNIMTKLLFANPNNS